MTNITVNTDNLNLICGDLCGINIHDITPDDVRAQGEINGSSDEQIEAAIVELLNAQDAE